MDRGRVSLMASQLGAIGQAACRRRARPAGRTWSRAAALIGCAIAGPVLTWCCLIACDFAGFMARK